MKEEQFVFASFSHEDAFRFVETVMHIVKEEKKKPVRIRVYLDGDIVAQYLMDGKRGVEWLNRKQNTVMKTGHSGLYVFHHAGDFTELAGDEQYAICGGGVPIYVNGELRGALCVSGLEHEEDHALIVQALQEMEEKK